jgi:hypothetical protein
MWVRTRPGRGFFYLDFMPTGHYTFRILALPEQFAAVWQEGWAPFYPRAGRKRTP